MGKIVKTVLKIAAVAAIAYFAPPLAAKLAGTLALKGAVATTALSGALGAGAGELAGVGWKTGLMAGGFAGAGKSGLFGGGAPPNTGAPPTAGGGASPFLNPSTPASLSGDPATAATGASPFLSAAAPASLAAPGVAGATGLGGALSTAGKTAGNVLKGGFQNVQAGLAGAGGAIGATTGVNLGAVAPTLLAAGLVGNPGGAMAKAQEAELARAQQVNAALTQQRIDQANQLFREGEYYDPEYMARQAAEAAMIRGGIQTVEQTRGLTGERLAAERRRMKLGTARTAGTAYQQGYGTGVGARTQTRQAGLAALPTSYAMSDSSSAINASNAADRQRGGEIAGLSALFGQALGRDQTDSLGA